MDKEQYSEMFAKVQNGQISEEVWFDYCLEILSQIIEENKSVFVRLKER